MQRGGTRWPVGSICHEGFPAPMESPCFHDEPYLCVQELVQVFSSLLFLWQKSNETKYLLHRAVIAQLLNGGRTATRYFENVIKNPRKTTQFIVHLGRRPSNLQPLWHLSTGRNGDAHLAYDPLPRRSTDPGVQVTFGSKKKAGYW